MRRNLPSPLLPALFLCATTLLVAQNSAALKQAWDLLSKGDRTGALQLAEKLVRDDPKDFDAHLLYGSLLSEENRAPEALAQLTEAVRLRPRSAEAQNDLGEAYNRFGQPKAARRSFEKAIQLKPDFGIAHLNLAQLLLDANELRSAAVHLDHAIALLAHSEDAADAHYLRAKVYTAQGDAQSAAAQLQKALALRPQMAEAWSDLGQAQKLLLNEDVARQAFEKAVQANPNDPIAQYRLGAQYLDADQLDPAITHLREAVRLNPSDQSTLNALQLALRRAGRTHEAEQVRQRLAGLLRNRDTNDRNALTAIQLNNEGAQLEKAGDVSAACEKYRSALALNPEHIGIRVNYAVALLRLGRWNEGLDQLRNALQRDPENSKIKAALKDAQAQAPR